MLPPTFYDRAYFNRTAPQIALASDDEIGGVAESLDALEVEIPWRARRTGRLLRTNIVYSPLVEFEPPRVVGQSGGYVVLDVEGLTPSTRIVAKWARTPTIVAGAVVSVISVLALAAVVGRVAVRQVGGARTRRARDGRHTLRRGDP